MDSAVAEVFIRDYTGFVSFPGLPVIALASQASGFAVNLANNWPVLYQDDRRWLDRYSHYYDPLGSPLPPVNALCEPGYSPPLTTFNVDQALLVICQNQELDWPLGGLTHQYPFGPPLWRGPSGTWDPGIEICFENVDIHMRLLRDNWGLPYPSELYNQVRNYTILRLYLHEFGHAFGIDHHDPDLYAGYHDCVIKIEDAGDYGYGPDFWSQYTWGQCYMNDEWNCSNEKGLRP